MRAGRTMIWQLPGRDRDPRFDRWEQLQGPALAVLPYVMLVVSAVLAVVLSKSAAATAITLGIAALTGVWRLWMVTLHPAWPTRPGRMACYFVVLVVLMAALVLRSTVFGFFSFTAYFTAFRLPGIGWRLLGISAVAAIAGTAQNGGLPKDTPQAIVVYIGILIINIVVFGALVWLSLVGDEQNDRRKQALAELSKAHRQLEATLAENAGLHDQLLAQAREAGVHDERQRMAREIHDTLAQSLAGIITQLQAADQSGQSGQDAGRRRHLDAALNLARESLSEARRSVHALRPEPLQGGRIEEALNVVAERWSALHGVAATVTTTGPARPMAPEAELALLRTAQESLTNVAKHAGATRVGLTLSYFGDQVTLDIRDDGVGFSPPGPAPTALAPVGLPVAGVAAAGLAPVPLAPVPSASVPPDSQLMSGFGLTVMRQRIEGLAGTLAIESEPGTGTTISASLPGTVLGVCP
jgi:signal transduction histidine kinase